MRFVLDEVLALLVRKLYLPIGVKIYGDTFREEPDRVNFFQKTIASFLSVLIVFSIFFAALYLFGLMALEYGHKN